MPMGSSAALRSMCGLLVRTPCAVTLALWALHVTRSMTTSRVSLCVEFSAETLLLAGEHQPDPLCRAY